MKFGCASEDITPDRPLEIQGQMSVRLGEYARDPLMVNATVLDDGTERVALLSIDVCMFTNKMALDLKKTCADSCDMDFERVLIATTHTHVAPCTSDRLFVSADEQFVDHLEKAIIAATSRAIADLEEVDLFAGSGHIDKMGWNRRGLLEDGSCHMYHGSWRQGFSGIEGPRDGGVEVIYARRKDGDVKGILTSFSTHPNCLETERLYSADIPGEVRKVLRSVLGAYVGICYFTGAAGDTAPSIMEDNPENIQPWRGEAGLKRSGSYLGGEILKVIASEVTPMSEPVLSLEATSLDIPIRPWDKSADYSAFKGGMADFFEKSRSDWDRVMAEESPVTTPLSVLRVGDAAIAFNPGELYCAFGLEVKAGSKSRVTLVAELADGWVGYIPTPQAIKNGGYSALVSEVARLSADAGDRIVASTLASIDRLFA